MSVALNKSFIFDEATHTYSLGDMRLPSVTQILKPVVNFDFVPPDVLAYKCHLGIAVHRACELLDQNNLDESSVSPPLIPYIEAWKLFKEQTEFQVLMNEQKMYHSSLLYAGTLDRVGVLNGRKVILDLKTSTALSKWVGLQLAGYSLLYKSMCGESLPRFAIQLKPDGLYHLEEFSDPLDYPVFQSLLNVYNWKGKHGLLKE